MEAKMDFETLLSFNCSVKVYDGKNTPRGYSCEFSFGSNDDRLCFQMILRATGGKKTMKFSPCNIASMAGRRVEEGHLTVNFEGVNWDMVVISDAKDKIALQNLYEMLERIQAGENFSGCDVTPTRNAMSSQRGVALSDRSGKRRPPLGLNTRTQAPTNWRGLAMLAAAQSSKTTKHTGNFYKSSAPSPADPFLPSQQSKVSPASTRVGGGPSYFKSPSVRRNLSVDMQSERQLPITAPAAGDENDINDFQQPKNYRQPLAIPSRSPLADLLSQPPSTAFNYPSSTRMSEDMEGFANLGNTCYMNAVLQSLLGLEPFAEDLLHHRLVKAVHPNSLYRMMFLLLKSKRSKDTFESQRILLKKIKAAISARASKFLGYRQQDAHELLSQCLDQLQDDLGHICKSNDDNTDGQDPLSPIVRNFECDIKHTITCKGCGKVTTNTEKIYDFALQLPKSVLLRPNEQANLQQLFDLYFSAEEVEYTCPMCSGKSATLSHQLAKLPRVLVLFLKRYGYNSQLSKNSKRVDNIRIPRIINTKHLCVDIAEPPCEFKGPWPKDPAALSALAASSEDKENVPRTTQQIAPLNQTNLLHLLATTNNDTTPSSTSSTKTSDVEPSCSSDVIPPRVPPSSPVQSASPHRTGQEQLHDCPVSPIFPPSPQPSSHNSSEQDLGSITDSLPLSPSFLAAPAQHTSERGDSAQTDRVEHHLAQPDHSDHQFTQVDVRLTQEDHSDQKPTQEHANTSSSDCPPVQNSLVYEQEAPVISRSATAVEKHNKGTCVLGKRKSSERDSHSSDDGYCTCGSSCDSTPSNSTTTTNANHTLTAATCTNCICHAARIKRKEHQNQPTEEPQLSSSEVTCGSDTNVSDGRHKNTGECMGTVTEVCKPVADSSNANVIEILDDFDRIFESPEAIAALQQEERPSTPTPPTPTAIASNDYHHQGEQLRSRTGAMPQLPELVGARPVPPLVTDSTVSSSTGELKMPDIELEIDIAKREDEELKKAMEESLKQQPNDFQLLQQLGMSEEDQLKLALELSIQESLPEEALLDASVPPSSPTPVTGTPTKETVDQHNRTISPEPGNIEVYRLVSVVSHIGKGSSGGHYISDVYSIGEHAWKTYNDSQVSDTREEDVRQRRQCTGYIFFYMHRSTFNSVARHHKH